MPITLLILYFSVLLILKLFNLPDEEKIIKMVTDFINQYGLIVVFISAVLEGLLLIGNYFPGGAVIFLGVISASGNIPRAIIVVLVVCLSFFIAYTINYFLGKYGWYKLFVKFGLQSTLDSMSQKLSKHVFSAILSSYWLPNLAAVCATTAGIMRVPLRRFIIQSTIGLVAWNFFWGIFVYITGDALLKMDILSILIMFCVWCLLVLAKVFIFDKKSLVKIESTNQENKV